ncbi:ABC transporter substrate-binding protein [Actinocatenispora thailandica]|uniref:ABC transporter substrate-binding protein n=1 Tax=Actinocatenispora thailandica TaxID=227318 RepID=A0A7R7HXM2_9ACTN|nr:ABC transporter substrate-binding protein [Actinocatenispora thailandica]BCJ35886.1 ABC transporter substrate-binding protein [Actinocatenispora thailandica]
MNRKPVLSIAAGALLAGTLAACGTTGGGSSTTAFDPKTCQGGTLEVLNQRDITHLDPARIYTSGGGNIPSLLFRTLTTRNRAAGAAGAKVVPDLATDLGTPSDNAKTWTYHLRSGLKYADGSAITSEDIKYGIERSFSPDLPGGAAYLRDWLVGAKNYAGPYKGDAKTRELAAIETPDTKTIVFHLNSPHGDFPYLATATQFAPVPKAKDDGVDYEKHPVSSGPYQIETYQKNKKLVLTRNKYWSRGVDPQRLACPDTIDITSGLNPDVINQRLAAGSGNDANAVTTDTDLGPAQLAQLQSNPELAKRVAKGNFPYTYYLTYDTTKAPFDKLKVREAFSYAVNRNSVINAIGGSSLGYPATTFLPAQKSMGYQPYDYFPAGKSGNPAKAKQLLAQAGYPHGLTVTLAHNNTADDPSGPEVATAVQDALKKAGITVKLQTIDSNSFYDTLNNPKTQPQLAIAGWGADWPSGGPFLIPLFDGRQIIASGGNFNTAMVDDPAVNKQIDKINAITDPAQAAKAWGALDASMGKQAWYVPLYHGKDLTLYGKNVKNAFVSDWTGVYDLSQLSVK